MFLPPVLIPACNLSSPAFLKMCSAYRLNKQGDSRQPCLTPFSILNQSVVPNRVLIVAFLPAYRLQISQETGEMVLYSILKKIFVRAFHSLL